MSAAEAFVLPALWASKGHKIAVASRKRTCRQCGGTIRKGSQMLPGRFRGTGVLCLDCTKKIVGSAGGAL